jgi:hypothetical protein
MVHLPTLKIVRVVQAIATQGLVCFVHLQQILAGLLHVPPKMVLLSIPKVVLAARVIARPPMVCFVWLQ